HLAGSADRVAVRPSWRHALGNPRGTDRWRRWTMTMDTLRDIRRIVRQEMLALHLAELGVVQEAHPHADKGDDNNHACTVRLRDTGLVLPRVPVAVGRKGLASIPDVGDLVLVQFIGGD